MYGISALILIMGPKSCEVSVVSILIKLIYSEKATKFCEISNVDLTGGDFAKNVAFSVYTDYGHPKKA